MRHIETVVITTKGGDVTINKSDFDEKKMTLAGSKPKAKKKAKAD
jgi:hypothetical protein